MIYVEIDPRFERLGNWMFKYAAAKTAAKGGEVTIVIDDDDYIHRFLEYRELFPDPIVKHAPEGAEVRIDLYADYKYIDPEIARKVFKAPTEREDFVSIHVRRGDYLHLPQFFPFVGEEYLRKAVASFGPERRFKVFSDDIKWCKKFFTGPRFEFSEGKTALEDLYGIARCRDHISSNSTFSWWGALLGPGGRTIFPSMWFGIANDVKDWSGYYFPGSEVIENSYSPALLRYAKWCIFKRSVRHFFKRLKHHK